MRILVTNDDGVASAGLAVLAQAALDRGHRVKVAAPAEEYSGASASLSGEDVDGKIALVDAPTAEVNASLDQAADYLRDVRVDDAARLDSVIAPYS